jgi:hypothetical protein
MHAALTRDLKAQTMVIRDLVYNGQTDSDNVTSNSRFISRAQVLENILRRETDLEDRAASAVPESLRFPTITERYEAVAEAHQKTFEWIFQPMVDKEDPNTVQWDDFVEWLREDKGFIGSMVKPLRGSPR